MEEKRIIGFIGAGNMAGAIINGILAKGCYKPGQICIFDVSEPKCREMREKGVQVAATASEVVKASDIIVLAVKPQNYAEVLSGLKDTITEKKVIVTIAAGISIAYVNDGLGVNCPVVRVMPNTPLLIGRGATALCRSANVTDADFEQVCALFSASGIVEVLTEDKMNAVISVNGSSPAYVYLFAKAVADSAERQGIDKETALKLFCQTLVGSAGMLLESGMTPDELIKMVSSPGGTTLKAMEALYEHHVEEAIDDAMLRCTKRAEELGR